MTLLLSSVALTIATVAATSAGVRHRTSRRRQAAGTAEYERELATCLANAERIAGEASILGHYGLPAAKPTSAGPQPASGPEVIEIARPDQELRSDRLVDVLLAAAELAERVLRSPELTETLLNAAEHAEQVVGADSRPALAAVR